MGRYAGPGVLRPFRRDRVTPVPGETPEEVVKRVILAVGLFALAIVIGGAAPVSAAAAAEAPTFTKDVLPLLQRSCQSCHRPGTAAPMALLTYGQVRPWARAIKDRVSTRQMPPWHLDRSIGVYRDDPSLSDAEIATIVGWVDAGAPQGNPEDAPPPIDLAALDEWAWGEPDLIVSMKDGFNIPAEGADMFPSEIVESGLTEDRYMKWVQLLTTANCCVHHEHVYAFTEQNPDDDDNVDTVHVTEYVMGNNGDYFPEGTGKLLYAGSKVRFAPHYHPWGEEVHDISRVGIKFYPRGEVPDLEVTSHRIRTGIGNDWTLNREKVEDLLLKQGIDLPLEGDAPLEPFLSEGNVNSLAQLSIPPHTVARSERFLRLEQAAIVINFQPHMHFRGSRMLLEAIHADGRRQLLTDVPNYEQVWQLTYTYEEPHLFPAGTILHSVAWHDNTAANKHNPDPSAWIGWGARTMDDMGNAWTDIAFMTDEQYEERRAAQLDRLANPRSRTNNEQ